MLSLRFTFSSALKNRLIGTTSTSINCLRNFSEMIDMPDKSLPIPKYQQKQNESTDVKKARLLYQSRKRGMLENGLLLSTFASQYLSSMNEKQLELYDNLINQISNDWDIFYYATNTKATPQEYDNEIMDMLKRHVKNENREKRIRQPDLEFN